MFIVISHKIMTNPGAQMAFFVINGIEETQIDLQDPVVFIFIFSLAFMHLMHCVSFVLVQENMDNRLHGFGYQSLATQTLFFFLV